MILKLYLVILASSFSASMDEHLPHSCRENEWMCSDGACIPSHFQCDGEVDCKDRSDENIGDCLSIYMRSLAIVSRLAGASSFKQNSLPSGTSTKGIERFVELGFNKAVFQRQRTTCELPEYPANGTYNTNKPNAKPGDTYDSVTIDVICKNGYGVDRPGEVKCQNGVWLAQIPNCVSQCHLPVNPSVEYRCIVSGSVKGSRDCKEFEPVGTLVIPKCRLHFYSPTSINMRMQCKINGKWANAAKCIPECGTVTAEGTSHIYGGRRAKKAEVPWHAGIYTKTKKPYEQICGGSLISSNVVISAAHCFWNDSMGQLPATDYAVAVGKLYRPWDDSMDEAQKSDVKEIHLPEHFQGEITHLQSDLAVMITAIPFKFNNYIRPVCVDFDYNFDREQLESGKKGKVAGWGLTNGTDKESPVLKVIELPFVSYGQCKKDLSEMFHGYLTNDKICAGFYRSTSSTSSPTSA